MPPRESGPWPAVATFRHRMPASSVWIRVSTDMPGSSRSSSFWPLSSAIRTGMRCTTLVKLPVALSGGSSANCEPLAGAIRSTRPRSFSPEKRVDGDVDRLARPDAGQLRLLVVGDDIDVRQRHDIDEVAADIDVVALLHLALADRRRRTEQRSGCSQAGVWPRPASPWRPRYRPRAASWCRCSTSS